MDFWRGRQRCNFVAVGGSFNALANGAQRVYTRPRHDARETNEGTRVPHLLYVGRLGCIYHTAACLEAHTHKHTHTNSLLFHPEAKNGRQFHLVGCLRTRNLPRGKHKSHTSTCWTLGMDNGGRSRWNAREATVLRLLSPSVGILVCTHVCAGRAYRFSVVCDGWIRSDCSFARRSQLDESERGWMGLKVICLEYRNW